jgi:hypothetical protein
MLAGDEAATASRRRPETSAMNSQILAVRCLARFSGCLLSSDSSAEDMLGSRPCQ